MVLVVLELRWLEIDRQTWRRWLLSEAVVGTVTGIEETCALALEMLGQRAGASEVC